MPIPLKLRKLTPTEKKKIKEIFKKKNSNKLGERARIINFAEQGFSVAEISKLLLCDKRKVRRWIKSFNINAIEGLYDKPRNGCPNKQEHYKETVLEIISSKPQKYSEAFANWTITTLKTRFQKESKEILSESSIRRILINAGWKCRSSRSIYQSNAPTEEEKQQRLIEISKEILGKHKILPKNKIVLSVDESHWDLRPRNGRVWTPPDVKQISCDIPKNKEDSFTTFGALDLYTGRFIYKISHWGYADTFLKFLYQIEQRFKGKQIHLILDKARIHTAHVIEAFLKRHKNIHFHYLLPRGSEINPIERFWRYSKDKIKKGTSFTDITDLYSATRKFFSAYSHGDYRYRSNLTLEKIRDSG